MTITIPYCPRNQWKGIDGIHALIKKARFSVLVAHRRFGKTVGVINHLIKEALTTTKKDCRYGYIAPYRNQAKSIAWDYLKHYSAPIPGIKINEGELSIDYPNGSRIRLFGADNADALRGLYFDGVVLDEIADMKPDVWGEIVRPALSDRRGFAVFIGTPKGQNLFFELYQQGRITDNWYAGMYRADETGVIPNEELTALKAEMSENQYRQELLCDFTAATDDAMISLDMVINAIKREISSDDIMLSPVVLGVDVARYGGDECVIFRRKGLIAYEPITFKSIDNMTFAAKVAETIDLHNPQSVFIDAGRGEGVIDRLRQLGYKNIIEVGFGMSPMNNRYANKRAEMWGLMAEWLKLGKIPDDKNLISELTIPTYSFDAANRILLEKKEKIKERCGFSPDRADALALTFAFPVKVQGADERKRRKVPKAGRMC